MGDAVMYVNFAILLNAVIIKVYSQPYQADSNGVCKNTKIEYLLDDGSNLCCRRCHPGTRLRIQCTNTTDSVCEQCSRGQYIERLNYSPTCFSCARCKPSKGLQYAQNCSSSIKSKCMCQPGMYCIMGFDDPYCAECARYRSCKPGYGVSRQGTSDSNVRCAPCPSGTFSDKDSYADTCQPHTDCQGRSVVNMGSPTSDTVCEPVATSHATLPPDPPTESQSSTVFTTTSPQRTTVLPSLGSWLNASSTDSMLKPSNYSTIDTSTVKLLPGIGITTVIACLIGSVVLFIIILAVLIMICKVIQRKGTRIFHPKTDTNGNCEAIEINKDYSVVTHLTSFADYPPEQHCLLGTAEPCSILSQSDNKAETLIMTECYSSQDGQSIGPLQSTVPLHNPHSTLSEPMTLLSNTEPTSSSQSTIPSQTTQPASPKLISPLPTSPQVNVNITFHIGNGSCATTSITPKDSAWTDPNLPLGKEVDCFSEPQQEAGKQALVPVQESDSYKESR